MATITRTEEMFTYRTDVLARASFWDELHRVINRVLMPDWVASFAEEKASEIERQRFYYS